MDNIKIVTIGVSDNLTDAYIDFGDGEFSTNQLMYVFGMIASILATEDGVPIYELQELLDGACSAFKIENEIIN